VEWDRLMPVWLIYTLINIALAATSVYLANLARQKAEDNIKAADLSIPTAKAGDPIPMVFGTALVAPNTVYYGGILKVKFHQWFYSMLGQHVLCWGVVRHILDISFNDKSCRNWHLTGGGDPVIDGAFSATTDHTPVLVDVKGNQNSRAGSSHAMFGGDEQQGGVGRDPSRESTPRGDLAFYFGFDDQPADALITNVMGTVFLHGPPAIAPRYPGLCYVRMGAWDTTPFYICAGSGTPAQMKVLLCSPAWWEGDTSPLGQSNADAQIGYDANPAEILYAILTNKLYGIGMDPALLDLPSFVAAAVYLRTEPITAEKSGFGISVTLTSASAAEQTINTILQHVGAALGTSPTTGLLRLKLVRDDYDPDALPVIDETNSFDVVYAPGTVAKTYNEIRITYKRLIQSDQTRGFVDDAVLDQDQASFESSGQVRSQSIDMPYFTDPDVAALVCARTRRAMSIPLAQVSWKMNREGSALMKGDVVAMNADAYGVEGLIVRITNVNYGSLLDGHLEFQGVEDAFAASHATFLPPAATGYVTPTVTQTDDSGAANPSDAAGITWGVGF
jgi:hypothetical protein